MRAWALLAVVSGCVSSRTVLCENGLSCPQDNLCDTAHGGCVTKSQVADCEGKDDRAQCDLPGEPGNCQQGVCLPIVCGNMRVDAGEMCDDGNHLAGDGCAEDCTSTEACGNEYVDVLFGETCDDGNFLDHDGCSSQCKDETLDWATLDVPPHGRFRGGIAFDARLDRVVLFGGRTQDPQAPSFHLGDLWTWDGQWSRPPATIAPPARSRHAMTYDAALQRTIIHGGAFGFGFASDTWAWDGSSWTQLADGPERSDHAMVYDEHNKKLVMFGGLSNTAVSSVDTNETWEFDGSAWKQAMPAQRPPPRQWASMTYDPDRGKVVLFGGCDFPSGCTGMNDVWEYDGTTWTPRTTTGAPALEDAAMAYDRIGHQLVVFSGNPTFNDPPQTTTYLLGASGTWTTAPTPMTARFGSMLVDDHRGGLLLFGGKEGGGGEPTDTWRWTGSAWQQAKLPSPRVDAAAAYDPDGRRVIVFGGAQSSVNVLGDTWELTSAGWHTLDATGPLDGSGMTYDAANHQVVRFGGYTTSAPSALTAVLVGSTWAALAPATSPPARGSPAFIFDASSKASLLFGGLGNAGPLDDTWSWNGTTWTPLTPATTPPARHHAAAGYDPVHKTIVMFGGTAASGPLADTWIWDGTDWHAAPPGAVSPQAREGASIIWNPARQRLLLTGGLRNRLDVWEWDGTAWTQIDTPTIAPYNLYGVTYPLLDGSGIAIVTGTGTNLRTDSWQLRFSSTHASDSCAIGADVDGDGLAGCADPDCWPICRPDCPPGVTCDATAPTCGDGTCNNAVESCRSCPGECTCSPACGDFICDPGETCAGDC